LDRTLPPVHLGVAYLLFAACARFVDDRPPSGPVTVGLVAGAVVPDLVDLPLYTRRRAERTDRCPLAARLDRAFRGRPARGRPVVGRRSYYAGRRGGLPLALPRRRRLAGGLGLPAEFRYLEGPLTQQPLYEGAKSLGAVGGATVTTLWIESALPTVALAVWWRDGRPGLEERNGYRDERWWEIVEKARQLIAATKN